LQMDTPNATFVSADGMKLPQRNQKNFIPKCG